MFSSSGEASAGDLSALKGDKIEAAALRSCSELGDWEFAGGGGDAEGGVWWYAAGDAGGEDASSRRAWMCMLPFSMGYLSIPSVPGWGLSCVSTPLNTKIVDRVTRDGTPTVPKTALKAFTLLSGNPAAQTVVASIACDPNVWSTVLQNEAHVEFLQSNAAEENFESSTDFHCDSATSNQSSDYEEVLKKSLQNIKTKVVDMVTNFSVYFNDLFAIPVEEKSPKKWSRRW